MQSHYASDAPVGMLRRTLWISLLVALALGTAATIYFLSRVGSDAWSPRHLPWLFAGFVVTAVFTCLNLSIRWVRWHLLTRHAGVRPTVKHSVLVYLATLPAIVTPFYVGELLRGLLLKRRYPLIGAQIFSIWLMERSSDALAVAALLSAASGKWHYLAIGLSLWLPLAGWVLWRHRRVAAAAVVGTLRVPSSGEAASAVGTLRVPSSGEAASAIGTLRVPEIDGTLHQHEQPASSSIGIADLAWCLVLSLAAWSLPSVSLWVVLAAPGMSDTPLTVPAAVESFSRSTLFGGVTGSPLGVAVTGSSMIARLQQFGVASSTATLAVFVFRAGSAWFAVSLGLVVAWCYRRGLGLLLSADSDLADPEDEDHFDQIADDYEQQIPLHVREKLLVRKIDRMQRILGSLDAAEPLRGLDVGCGQGWYAAEMARRGYSMVGIDRSAGQVRFARQHAVKEKLSLDFRQADGTELPFEDAAFDFVYAINVLHHFPDQASQLRGLAEILRVLRPGGLFLLHEANTRNPLFRFYLNYVFPVLRPIDEGIEWWVRPDQLPAIDGGQWRSDIDYFTFLPDFIPAVGLRMFSGLEGRLERSRLASMSAHYMAVLEKDVACQPVA